MKEATVRVCRGGRKRWNYGCRRERVAKRLVSTSETGDALSGRVVTIVDDREELDGDQGTLSGNERHVTGDRGHALGKKGRPLSNC
jgi:hypothetical protein